MLLPILRPVLLAASALLMTALPARADFRLCNNTASRVGIAIGYRDKEGWLTEGWWNVSSRSCETILKGPLASRYYYIYAVDYDQGGEWGGKSFMCTRDKEFTIRGFQDCLSRSYDRTGFFEIDSGEQKSWTVQLSEQAQSGAKPKSSAPENVTPAPPASPEVNPEPKQTEQPQTDTSPATPAVPPPSPPTPPQ